MVYTTGLAVRARGPHNSQTFELVGSQTGKPVPQDENCHVLIRGFSSPLFSVDNVVAAIVTYEYPTFDSSALCLSYEKDDGTFDAIWYNLTNATRDDLLWSLTRLNFRGEK